MSYTELISFTIMMVTTLGFIAFLMSKSYRISSIPILIILGLLFGPILNIIPRELSHHIFGYARIFGLVIILFAEGQNLKWSLIKKHLTSIVLLDTVGLLITAIIAGWLFSMVFHLPFSAGFLFGAIISATDPATLIPLFKQHHVDEDIKTVIVTESIFNDPLGIVLTILAVALIIPQATEAHLLESISHYTTIYPAAVLFFLYEIISAILIGAVLGIIGFWIVKKINSDIYPEIYGLIMAFGGFFIGEFALTSGYLVATTIGIVFGNHDLIFKGEKGNPNFNAFLSDELKFSEILSELASVFIFVLLGATINLEIIGNTLLKGSIIALAIIFIVRPLAVLIILPLKQWDFKQYLFIALEGPRGVVPSAMAGLPLSLGLLYHDKILIHWGEIILSSTLITIILSVIIETIWVKYLANKLLKKNVHEIKDSPKIV